MLRSTVLVTVLSVSIQLARSSPASPPAKIYDVNRSVAPELSIPNLGSLTLKPGRKQSPAQRQAAALVNAHESIQAYHNAQHAATLARLQAQALPQRRQQSVAGHLASTSDRQVSRADRQAPAVVTPQELLRSYQNAQRFLDPGQGAGHARSAQGKGSQPVYTVRVNTAASQPYQVQRILAERYIAQHRSNVINKARSSVAGPSSQAAKLKGNPARATSVESVGENTLYRPTSHRVGYRGDPIPSFNRRPLIDMQDSEAGAFTKFARGSNKRIAEDDPSIDLQSKLPRLSIPAESSTVKSSSTTAVPFPIDRWSTKNLLSRMPTTSTPERSQSAPRNDVDTSLTLRRPDGPTVADANQKVDTNLSL